jgi:hypothetical protein
VRQENYLNLSFTHRLTQLLSEWLVRENEKEVDSIATWNWVNNGFDSILKFEMRSLFDLALNDKKRRCSHN